MSDEEDEKVEVECFVRSCDPPEEKYAVAKTDATKAAKTIFATIRSMGEIYGWSPHQTMIPVGLAMLMLLQYVEEKDKEWFKGILSDAKLFRSNGDERHTH